MSSPMKLPAQRLFSVVFMLTRMAALLRQAGNAFGDSRRNL